MQNTKATGLIYVLRLETRRPGLTAPALELMSFDPVKKMYGIPEKITTRVIKQHFATAPLSLQQALTGFSEEALKAKREELAKKHKAGRNSQPLSVFTTAAMQRYGQECFAALREQGDSIRLMHGVPVEGARVRLQSCKLMPEPPRLSFRVDREDEKLVLRTLVDLGSGPEPLEGFLRHHFLLERNNEYALLAQRDYATLLWLHKTCPGAWEGDPLQFSEQVLDVLDKQYRVDRNNCFTENVIDCIPENRVYLSEMTGQYLVFTPAWNYEGIELNGNWKEEERHKAGGREWLIRRHRATEDAFVEELRALHPNFANQLNGYFYLAFKDAQHKGWFLNAFYKLLDRDVSVLGLSMLQHFRCSEHKPVTETELLSAPDDPQIRVRFSLTFGKESVPLPALQKAVFSGQRIVLLRDGAMGVLPAEWFDTWATLIRHARIEKDVFTVPRWLALAGEEGESSVLKPVINAGWWARWQQWQKSEDAQVPLPAQLRAQLRPYQQKGYEWLLLLRDAGASGCLADDMGLGKTVQTIAFICRLLEENPDGRHLIICPASLVYNWKQEWEQFAPAVRTGLFQREGSDADAAPPQVLIATYHLVRNHTAQLEQVTFDSIILDESHQIKNPAAQITRAVCSLQGRFRAALSGTPVMNNTFDLYAQLNFLLPGMFGSREFFRQQYADAIDRNADAEKIAALRRLTAPFILRRTKTQVATDLPAKTEQVLWCSMGTDQRMAYESVKDKIRSNVLLEIEQKGLEQGKMSVLAGITRLKQLCCSAELVSDEDVFTQDSVKTTVLLEELEQLVTDHKVLLFSQYTGMLDLLGEALKKARIPFLRLDGSTPPEQRQGLCNRFNDEASSERVFLLSLKAGNAGLNLMAADYVFLFDIWWNASVEQQAIDRTHRIGQTRPVFAYRLICKDTIEEKILQLQQRKSHLSSELIQAEEGFVKSLTLDDVKFLLD
ncbi:MAG: DEAD/DEAH box helicase [Chitinophagaceae bacterium]|nr:MAG: DEAD/DEAH box helicase [Chitinophagaceae bacterium]